MMMWMFLLIRGMSTLFFFDTRTRLWRKEGLIPMQSMVECFFHISVFAVSSFSGRDSVQ